MEVRFIKEETYNYLCGLQLSPDCNEMQHKYTRPNHATDKNDQHYHTTAYCWLLYYLLQVYFDINRTVTIFRIFCISTLIIAHNSIS